MSLEHVRLVEELKSIERDGCLKLFLEILKCIENHSVTPEYVNTWLICNVDHERIIEKSDSLLSDLYYSLLHYSFKEENITVKELQYFFECINGTRVHDFEDKINFLKENS